MYRATDYKAIVEAGGVVPPDFEPPEIMQGFRGWYDDFFELSTDRQIGMAVGPIPAASIARHVAGWPDEDAQMFALCIRAMDKVWMARGSDGEGPDDNGMSARDSVRSAFR